MGEKADEHKSSSNLKKFQKVTGEMEDTEEITTDVTESIQAHLDSRRDEVRRNISFRQNINKNCG